MVKVSLSSASGLLGYKMKFPLLILFLLAHFCGATEESEPAVTVLVDVLVKPTLDRTSSGKVIRSYAKSNDVMRLVWEPFTKFHYRIKRSHVLSGVKAQELCDFIHRQVDNKRPTGWVGHEAEYAVSIIANGEEILKVTLSTESGSSVYLEDEEPRIGHFNRDLGILKLLNNSNDNPQRNFHDEEFTQGIDQGRIEAAWLSAGRHHFYWTCASREKEKSENIIGLMAMWNDRMWYLLPELYSFTQSDRTGEKERKASKKILKKLVNHFADYPREIADVGPLNFVDEFNEKNKLEKGSKISKQNADVQMRLQKPLKEFEFMLNESLKEASEKDLEIQLLLKKLSEKS